MLTFIRSLVLIACIQLQPPSDPDAIYQFSTMRALVEGQLDGQMTIANLAKHGDFGLGTFNGLDGELVARDGHFFQIKSDGSVQTAAKGDFSPLATVKFFRTDAQFQTNQSTLSEIEKQIDSRCKRNSFVAIRIKGRFSAVLVRAAKKQSTPYKPLSQIKDFQNEFNLGEVDGELIGFRCPKFTTPITVGGYHWHFLADDLHGGGHILQCTIDKATVSLDETSSFDLKLPDSGAAADAQLDGDAADSINRIERGTSILKH